MGVIILISFYAHVIQASYAKLVTAAVVFGAYVGDKLLCNPQNIQIMMMITICTYPVMLISVLSGR